jgi:hypothetical protein
MGSSLHQHEQPLQGFRRCLFGIHGDGRDYDQVVNVFAHVLRALSDGSDTGSVHPNFGDQSVEHVDDLRRAECDRQL